MSPPSPGCEATLSQEPGGSAVSHSARGVWGGQCGWGEVELRAPPPISPRQRWPLPLFAVCVLLLKGGGDMVLPWGTRLLFIN